MTPTIHTVIVPVSDLAGTRALLGALLGAEPVMDQPYYVQFDVGGQHIGLDPNGADKGLTGPVPYWQVSDIHATLTQLTAAGAKEKEAVRDVGNGRLIASVTDADGNVFGLLQEP